MSLVATALAGCGGDPGPARVPATGIVVDEDWDPVGIGAIYFHPDASNAFQGDVPSSLLQTDGSFTMKTFPYGEGVTPGKYKVTLGDEIASRLKKPEYANKEKTPWSVEVTEAGAVGQIFEVK